MTRLHSWLRACGAFLVIVGVVVGGASALIVFGRLNVFTTIDWAASWYRPDDGSLLLGLITVVGWVAWLLAGLSLLSEALAAATRQRWRLRFPGIDVFAPASAVLITAIVGLVASQTIPVSSAQAAPAPEPAPASPVIVDHHQAVTTNSAAVHLHTVQPGDDLWSLAERYYQDGSRWREIAAANDTVLLTATDHLEVGMVLAVPDAHPNPPTAVLVRPGDSLSSLASQYLGDPERWPEIVAANSDLIGDPDAIQAGWWLKLPTPVIKTPPAPPTPAGQPIEIGSCPADQPAPIDPADQPAPADDAETAPSAQAANWAGLPAALGTVLVTGLSAAFLLRRRQQLARRPLGRRLPPLPTPARQASTALTHAASKNTAADHNDQHSLTAVMLGETATGQLWCDLAKEPVIWLRGTDGTDVAMLTAIALSLGCVPGTSVVAAGPGMGWLTSLDEPELSVRADTEEALAWLHQLSGQRRRNLPNGATAAQLRTDPVLAEAWAPAVLLLAAAPAQELPAGLAELGLSVIVAGGLATPPPDAALIELRADEKADFAGKIFTPSMVAAPARRVLQEVFETANKTEYPPAPWWDEQPGSELANVVHVASWPGSVEGAPVAANDEPDHPVIKLLGAVQLCGARGPSPSRAVKQCIEYGAWLLEHPGATAVAMAADLMVAEATRRSNMSRLRSWLGTDEHGAAYLPDAYSGRIMLHPGITSDWEQFQLLLSPGANRVPNASLVRCLELVRGAPLADAAPGQWHWAEQLRHDMISAITDAAVLLARRAIDAHDFDLAQWACDRAATAGSQDETLVGVQIQLAQVKGEDDLVDRLILQLTRRARALGIDLADDTVVVLQEVVEGRSRLRRA